MIREKIISLLMVLTMVLPGTALSLSSPDDLKIDVWLDRGDGSVYTQGDPVTVYFKASADCFVTVYNIDTDGYVHILFPTFPGEGNYVKGGATYFIPAPEHEEFFVIDELPGIGYVEAVASHEPFSLDGWPFYAVAGDEGHYSDAVVEKISGDPFLAIEEINSRILPVGENTSYADDFGLYYVEEVVDYPRYVYDDYQTSGYYPYYYPSSYVVFDYWWFGYYPYGYYPYGYYPYYYYPYYDYYYWATPPPYLGRDYTRKYGYTRKVNDRYGTKGYGDKGNAVRVNDYYKGKETTRGDFRVMDIEKNPMVAFKPPRVADADRTLPDAVARKPLASEGKGEVPLVSGKQQPAVTEGRSGERAQEVRPKAPPRETPSNPAGNESRTARKTVAREGGGEQPETPARVPVKPPVWEERGSQGRKGGTVAQRSSETASPQREESRNRVETRIESRKEYQLRGWDRAKSGDTKKSSGISIIRPEPRSHSDSKISRERGSSRSAPSMRSAPRPTSKSFSSPSSSARMGKSSGSTRRK
jgi:hypothetical protein